MEGLNIISVCVNCGSTENIHRHHIDSCKYFMRAGFVSEEYYESYQDIALLCSVCHKQITNINRVFSKFWWKKQNKWALVKRGKKDYRKLYKHIRNLFVLYLHTKHKDLRACRLFGKTLALRSSTRRTLKSMNLKEQFILKHIPNAIF